MPMRRGYAAAKGHIWDNLLIWIGALTVAGVLAVVMRWGTTAAVCFMLVGILVMMVAEKGIVPVHEPLAEEDESRPEGVAPSLQQP